MASRYGGKIINDKLLLCLDGANVNPTYNNFNNTDIVTEFVNLKPNGSSNEETLEMGLDPWGRTTVLDRSLNNDTTSNYDGGDTSNTYTGVDSSVKYRFTYWFRVDEKGNNGNLYFGLYGYNSSGSNIAIRNNGGSSGTTNPYFSYPGHTNSQFEEGKWYMFVAYVHPAGSTNPTDTTAGFYDVATGLKITNPSSGNVSHNAVWDSTHTKTQYRYYLYYSTDPNVKMSWYESRIEKIDGNEPSITDMLNAPPDRLNDLTNNGYNARSRNGLSYNSSDKSLSFTANDTSHLIIPSYSDLDITGDMTIECWVNLNSTMNGALCELAIKRSNSDYTSPFGLYFEDRSGQNLFAVLLGGGGSTYTIVGSNNNFNGVYGKWDHVVFTISGTAMTMYVNGTQGGTATFSGTRQTNTTPLRLGGIYSYYTGNYMLDGKIGAYRMYTKALNSAEVLNNYNTSKSRFGL
jgi:hypothetical protein